MKKVFTSIILAAMALSAAAQSFTITKGAGGETLASGSSIDVPYEKEEMPWGEIDYKWDSGLYVNAAHDMRMAIEITLTPADATGFSVCLGACQVINNGSFTKTDMVKKGESNLQFHRELYDEAPQATVSAKVVLYPEGKSADAQTVTVNFLPTDEAGVNSVAADNNSIRLVGRELLCGLEGKSELAVYNLCGAKALSTVVDGNASVSLASLAPGVYIVKAGAKSCKIVLR